MRPIPPYGPRRLLHFFLTVPWEIFGAFVAIVLGAVSAMLIFYPSPYEISKGYTGISQLISSAKVLGLLGFLPALAFILLAGTRASIWALMCLGGWITLMWLCSWWSVGWSPGTFLYFVLTLLAGWAHLRSGSAWRFWKGRPPHDAR